MYLERSMNRKQVRVVIIVAFNISLIETGISEQDMI